MRCFPGRRCDSGRGSSIKGPLRYCTLQQRWLLNYITSYVCTLCMQGCERGTQYCKSCQPTRAAQTIEPVMWSSVRQNLPCNNVVYYTTGYALLCCPHTITGVTIYNDITGYVCTLCMQGCERGTQYCRRCQPTRAAQTIEPVMW